MKMRNKVLMGGMIFSGAAFICLKMYDHKKKEGSVKFWEKENVNDKVKEDDEEVDAEFNMYDRKTPKENNFDFVSETYNYITNLSYEDLASIYLSRWGEYYNNFSYEELLDNFLLIYNMKLDEKRAQYSTMRSDDLRMEYEGITKLSSREMDDEEIISELLRFEFEII